MGRPPPIRLLAPLATVLAVLAAAPQAFACAGRAYGYAGLASAGRAYGVAADVTALAAPLVREGHVAAWVGVGGPHEGPNGADEWIQVGISGFPGSGLSSLYYEVATPRGGPRYVELERGLATGSRRRVAVLETRRPNTWRVWVDGRPVSPPIRLPGSQGAWRAVATAESWGADGSGCNAFSYRFDEIAVATHAGGGWRPLAGALPIESAGYRLSRPAAATLIASSGAPPRATLR